MSPQHHWCHRVPTNTNNVTTSPLVPSGPDKHQQCHHITIGATGSRQTPTISPPPLVPPGPDRHHWCHHHQWCLVSVLTLCMLWLADFTFLMSRIPLGEIPASPTRLHPLPWTPPPPACPKHPHHIERAPRPKITLNFCFIILSILLYIFSYVFKILQLFYLSFLKDFCMIFQNYYHIIIHIQIDK